MIFSVEGDGGSTVPVGGASNDVVTGDAEQGQGLVPASWASGVGPPEPGSRIVDHAAGDGKLGTLVAISPGEPTGRVMHDRCSMLPD